MKNLISKKYFDTGSVENLVSLLNTYYQLINNSKSHNENFLARHLNFVKYLRQLLNEKLTGKDDAELSILYDNIKKENVTSKSWLLKKIISNDQYTMSNEQCFNDSYCALSKIRKIPSFQKMKSLFIRLSSRVYLFATSYY